jgi:hypothetical protein
MYTIHENMLERRTLYIHAAVPHCSIFEATSPFGHSNQHPQQNLDMENLHLLAPKKTHEFCFSRLRV